MGRHHRFALRYFLEAEETVVSDWSWLENMSSKSISMKTKFQTETIHKLSLSLMLMTNSFEAILIYQIANLKDPNVKETIQKVFSKIYIEAEEFQEELDRALKFIWRIDLLCLLIIYLRVNQDLSCRWTRTLK